MKINVCCRWKEQILPLLSSRFGSSSFPKKILCHFCTQVRTGNFVDAVRYLLLWNSTMAVNGSNYRDQWKARQEVRELHEEYTVVIIRRVDLIVGMPPSEVSCSRASLKVFTVRLQKCCFERDGPFWRTTPIFTGERAFSVWISQANQSYCLW